MRPCKEGSLISITASLHSLPCGHTQARSPVISSYSIYKIKVKSLSQSEGTLLTTQKDGIELKAPLITARRKHAIQFIIESLRAVARTGIVFLLIPRNARLVVSSYIRSRLHLGWTPVLGIKTDKEPIGPSKKRKSQKGRSGQLWVLETIPSVSLLRK